MTEAGSHGDAPPEAESPGDGAEPASSGMSPDDEVCMCYHVSLRKLTNYTRREQPRVASGLSECLGAGTGCGWCRPFLQSIFEQCRAGATPEIDLSPAAYAEERARYRAALRAKRAAEDGD